MKSIRLSTLDPEVYLLAAELIFTDWNHYSCAAIMNAYWQLYGKRHSNRHTKAYRAMFQPAPGELSIHPFWNKPQRFKKERENALLFMAAIVGNP